MAGCVAQTSREICVHEDVDLSRSVANQRRTHQSEYVQKSFVPQIPLRAPGESSAPNAGQEERQLRGTAQDNAECHAAHGADRS